MTNTLRDYEITRGDGRKVTFTGYKFAHAGKGCIYITKAGNRVFHYAPYSNGVGVIVEPLPTSLKGAEEVMSRHCTGYELDKLLGALGGGHIHID